MADEHSDVNDTIASGIGEFFCQLCRLEFSSEEELEEHSWTILHHSKLNKSKGRDCVHECSLCKEKFFELLSFTSHLHSDTHQAKYLAWKKEWQHSEWKSTEEVYTSYPACTENLNDKTTAKEIGRKGKYPWHGSQNRNRGRGNRPRYPRERSSRVRLHRPRLPGSGLNHRDIQGHSGDCNYKLGSREHGAENKRARKSEMCSRDSRINSRGEQEPEGSHFSDYEQDSNFLSFDFPNPEWHHRYHWRRPGFQYSNRPVNYQHEGYQAADFRANFSGSELNRSMDDSGRSGSSVRSHEYNKTSEALKGDSDQPRHATSTSTYTWDLGSKARISPSGFIESDKHDKDSRNSAASESVLQKCASPTTGISPKSSTGGGFLVIENSRTGSMSNEIEIRIPATQEIEGKENNGRTGSESRDCKLKNPMDPFVDSNPWDWRLPGGKNHHDKFPPTSTGHTSSNNTSTSFDAVGVMGNRQGVITGSVDDPLQQNTEETQRSVLGNKKQQEDASQVTDRLTGYVVTDGYLKTVKQKPGSKKESDKGLVSECTTSVHNSDEPARPRCSFVHIDGVRCEAITFERYCSYHKRFTEAENHNQKVQSDKYDFSERSSSAPLEITTTSHETQVNVHNTLPFKAAMRWPRMGDNANWNSLRMHGPSRRLSTHSEGAEPRNSNMYKDNQITSTGVSVQRPCESSERGCVQAYPPGISDEGTIPTAAAVVKTEARDEAENVQMIDLSFSTKYLSQPHSLGFNTVTDPEGRLKSSSELVTSSSSGNTTTTFTESGSFSREPIVSRNKHDAKYLDMILKESDKAQESTTRSFESFLTRPIPASPSSDIISRFRHFKPNWPSSFGSKDVSEVNPVQPVSPCLPPPSLSRTSPVSSNGAALLRQPSRSPTIGAAAIRNVDFSRLNLPPHVRRALVMKYAAKKQQEVFSTAPSVSPNVSTSRSRFVEGTKVQCQEERQGLSSPEQLGGSTEPCRLLPSTPSRIRLNRSSSLDSFPMKRDLIVERSPEKPYSHKGFALASTFERRPPSVVVNAKALLAGSLAVRRHSRAGGEARSSSIIPGCGIDLAHSDGMIDLSTASYLTSVAAPETGKMNNVESVDRGTLSTGLALRGISSRAQGYKTVGFSGLGRRKDDAEMERGSQLSSMVPTGMLSPGLLDFRLTAPSNLEAPDGKEHFIISEPVTKTTETNRTGDVLMNLQHHRLVDLSSSSSLLPGDNQRNTTVEHKEISTHTVSSGLQKYGLLDLSTMALPEMRSVGKEAENHISSSSKRQLEDIDTEMTAKREKRESVKNLDDSTVRYASGVDIQQLLRLEREEQKQSQALNRVQERIKVARSKMQKLSEVLDRLHSVENEIATKISSSKSERLQLLKNALHGKDTKQMLRGSNVELFTIGTSDCKSTTVTSTAMTKAFDSVESRKGRGTSYTIQDSRSQWKQREAHLFPSSEVFSDTSKTSCHDYGNLLSELPTFPSSEVSQRTNPEEHQIEFGNDVIVKIEVSDEETAARIAALGPVVSIADDPNNEGFGMLILQADNVSQGPIEYHMPEMQEDLVKTGPQAHESPVMRQMPRKISIASLDTQTSTTEKRQDVTAVNTNATGVAPAGKGTEVSTLLTQNRKELMKKINLHSGTNQLKKRKKKFSEAKVSDTLALSKERIQSVRERMKTWRGELEHMGSSSSILTSRADTVRGSSSSTTQSVFYKDTALTPSRIPVRDTRHSSRKTTKELKKSSMFRSKRTSDNTKEGDHNELHTDSGHVEGFNKACKQQDRRPETNKEKEKGKTREKAHSRKRKDRRTSKEPTNNAPGKTSTITSVQCTPQTLKLSAGTSEELHRGEPGAIQTEDSRPIAVSHVQVPTATVEAVKKQFQRKSKVTKSSDAMVAKFEGHTGAVCGIKVLEGRLYTCSADKTTKAFDLKSGECVKVYEGHHHAVNCLEVSEEGERLFTGSNDQTVRSYNIKTGVCTHKFTFDGRVMCLHAGFDLLFVGLNTGIVTCVDLKSNACVERLHCHEPRGVSCLATATEGPRKLLCSGSFDATISIRDYQSGLLTRILNSHTMTVLCLQVVENVIYSGGADCTVLAHNLNTGELLRSYGGHTLSVSGLQVVGRVLVTSCLDKLVRCYDLMSAELLQAYGGQTDMIFSVHMAHGRIYSGARNGTVISVKLDLRVYYPCKWKDCQLNFGITSHMKDHVKEFHVMQQGSITNCHWADCEHVFAEKDSIETILDHVLGHVESRSTRKSDS